MAGMAITMIKVRKARARRVPRYFFSFSEVWRGIGSSTLVKPPRWRKRGN
jgi:hypothetical protein